MRLSAHGLLWLWLCLGFGFVFGLLLSGCAPEEETICDDGACDALPDAAVPTREPPKAMVVSEERACAMQSTTAQAGIDKQVDILFVIDNSGSMSEEIAAIRANINQSFAAIVEDSGVDYRVLVLSLYGTGQTAVCIEPPLAGAPCTDGLFATNSDVLFHYNASIESGDGLCKLLVALDSPDPDDRVPGGLRAWLRPDAEKVIVVITDDSPSCSYPGREGTLSLGHSDPFEDALAFHRTLLAMAPEQFGQASEPRYAFYSIVGLSPHATPTAPYFPHEALVSETCSTAPTPGLTYQALSVITDALRYPVCEGRGFDAVFRVLARSVVESAKAECSFVLPEAPEGQILERSSIHVRYMPGSGGPAETLEQLEDGERCGAHGFELQDERIVLCPAACALVEADRQAELQVLYGCTVDVE